MYSEKTKCLLRCFGVDNTYQGYQFCIYSIELVSKNPEALTHITKYIYPDVAKKFNTNCNCVERNIRTIVEAIWRRGGKQYFTNIMGYELTDERPSNAKFLELLSTCIIMEDYPCKTCRIVTKLKAEISTLNESNEWMHDLIWELVKKYRLT